MNTLKAEHLKVAELSSLYEILQIIERWAAYLWFNSLSYISIPGFSTDSFWFTILKWDWITCIKFNIYIIFESQWHHQCDFLLTTLFSDIGCCFGIVEIRREKTLDETFPYANRKRNIHFSQFPVPKLDIRCVNW